MAASLLAGDLQGNTPIKGKNILQTVQTPYTPQTPYTQEIKKSIPLFHDLEGLVCGSDPRDVVLFGTQANFSFSIALASLRANGSQGITATCFKEDLTRKPTRGGYHATTLPDFNKSKKENLDWCITNGSYSNDGTLWGLNLSNAKKLTNIKAALDVSDFSRTWRNDVQALLLEIPDDLMVAGKVVWFQCPWIPRSEKRYSTSGLIKDFMKAMEKRQQVGDYLLIGITQHDDYFQEYNLEEMQLEQKIYGYRFQGADTELIKKILGRGYKHEAYEKDIHGYIFNEHETLVFKKMSSEEDFADMMSSLAINDDDSLLTRVTTKEVVVFKEEDRSFTAALAEMHAEKLNAIKTGYLFENPSDNHYISMILHQCIINGEKAQLHPAEIVENIESHLQLVYIGKVVWYQLPPSCDVKVEQIKSFMSNIGKKQVTGDYLLIGTTTSSQFTALKIGGMIGDGNEGHAYNGYKFIRIDVKLINMLTARGYKHGSTDARVLVYEKAGRGAERKGMTPKPKAK
uniref:Uncharacterized protein n=1 Tax=Amphimedon queenslandica TaxID=400682 RepID=A0A1X7U5B0_AMPQE